MAGGQQYYSLPTVNDILGYKKQDTDLTTVCVISCTSAFFLSAMSCCRSRITFIAEPSSTRL